MVFLSTLHGVTLGEEVEHEETAEAFPWRASVWEGDIEMCCSQGGMRVCVKSSCLSYVKILLHGTALLWDFLNEHHSCEIHYLVSWATSEDIFFSCIFSSGVSCGWGRERAKIWKHGGLNAPSC